MSDIAETARAGRDTGDASPDAGGQDLARPRSLDWIERLIAFNTVSRESNLGLIETIRDHVAGKLDVRVPIVPGVISILNAAQTIRFTQLCGAKISPTLHAKLDALGNDEAAAAEFGIEYATRQCEELLRAGVPGLHFYTLNKSRSTVQIVKNLGLA